MMGSNQRTDKLANIAVQHYRLERLKRLSSPSEDQEDLPQEIDLSQLDTTEVKWEKNNKIEYWEDPQGEQVQICTVL